MNTLLDSKLKISDNVLSQEVGGETVLLDLQSEHYFGLDEVSTHFWQLLKEDHQLPQIVAQLMEQYDVEKQQLEDDLCDLINKLLKAGLISIENAQ